MTQDFQLIIIAILFFREILRFLKSRIFRNILARLKPPASSPRPRMMKPKSENACHFCMTEKATGNHLGESCPHIPISWRLRKGQGGRKKRIVTLGYACPNPKCEYYGIIDEQIYALMGYGSHGKVEAIQDFYCQSCNRKISARLNTVLYRLKTPSQVVSLILWLLALGVDLSSLEELKADAQLTGFANTALNK